MRVAAMGTGDFLRKRAETPLQEYFLAAGATCELSTNSSAILEAARETFVPMPEPGTRTDFRLRFWVDDSLTSGPPWPTPYVRGLSDLIFAGLDPQNSVLVDRRGLRAIGRFSRAMAADQDYWRMAVLPLVISIFGESIGSTELHCGCVAINGRGILLAGPSGSGKSTLCWALARLGFSFLSDDRIHLSRRSGELRAWSASPRVKMRPEAVRLFPELGRTALRRLPDGQDVYNFEPEREFGVLRSQSCKPRGVFFLERQQRAVFDLTSMSPYAAAQELSLDLLAETPELSRIQAAAISELVKGKCWKLAYGGCPAVVAKSLAVFCEELISSKSPDHNGSI
jgi:hypothetical protein